MSDAPGGARSASWSLTLLHSRAVIAGVSISLLAASGISTGFVLTGGVAQAAPVAAADSCGYPSAVINPPKGATTFNENTLTKHVDVYGTGQSATIAVFSNDESGVLLGQQTNGGTAPTLFAPFSSSTLNTALGTGVHTSIVIDSVPTALANGAKLKIGTGAGALTQNVTVNHVGGYAAGGGPVTITINSFNNPNNYPIGTLVTFDPANANFVASNSANNPSLGDTSGTGVDAAGRPVAPTLFITDITGGPSTLGDWQQGGAHPTTTINDVFGTWDTATLVGATYTPTIPANKNNWSLGAGSDTPSGGFAALGNEGYGTEFRWNANNPNLLDNTGAALQSGHTYRIQVMTHDGDQNKGGGDVGELCTNIVIPPSAIATHVLNGSGTDITGTTPGSPAAGGSIVHDHAVVSGNGVTAPTGNVTFTFFTNSACTLPAAGSPAPQTVLLTTSGTTGVADSTAISPALAAGSYAYKVSYTGDGTYLPSVGDCEPFAIGKLTPTVDTTVLNNGVAIAGPVTTGDPISDSATVTGSGATPTGSVTFTFYTGVNCATAAGLPAPETVALGAPSPAGTAVSTAHAAGATGDYGYEVTYTGDGTYAATTVGTCEPFSVGKTGTSVTTVPSATSILASTGSVTDTATIHGGAASPNQPTGTIDFALWPSANTLCSGAPAAAYTNTQNVVAGTTAYTTSPAATGLAAGTYYWQATYSGDGNNAGSADLCQDAAEKVIVQANTALSTTPSSATLNQGDKSSDTAHLSGGVAAGPTQPTGSITFTLWPAANTTCAGAPIAIFTTTTTPVNGNGDYPSASSPALSPGDYFWRADYSGDTFNAPSSETCAAGQIGEKVHVLASTSISTTPSASSIVEGGSVSDTAVLGNMVAPAAPVGTLTFALYADADNSCLTPLFTTPVNATSAVTGNGSYSSPSVAIPTAGTYFWQATYSGDANNLPAVEGCQDKTEQVVVSRPNIPPPPPGKANPTISTFATQAALVNNVISDAATLAGGNSPTGSILFTLYGPNNTTCTAPPVFSLSIPVTGNGTYSALPGFTASLLGVYNWTAAYSGDGNNDPATETCGGTNEASTVSSTPPPAALHIVKTGPPIAHIGDVLTYTLTVTSTTSTPVTGVVVSDPLCTSTPVLVSQAPAPSTTLGPGDVWTYTCDHTVAASDPDPFVNTALAVGTNASQVSATFSTDIIHPAITIVKTVTPTTGAVGTVVNYTYTVTNSGDVTLHNVVVNDDKLGLIGTVATLTPGQTVTLHKKFTLATVGELTNTAIAAGTDPLGTVVDNNSAVTVPVTAVLGEKVTLPSLPFTGLDATSLTRDALVLIGFGIMALVLTRRRRRT